MTEQNYTQEQLGAIIGKARTALTPDAHREWVDKANAKLAAIDPAAWTAEEITAFAASLGELKKTILALLKTKPVTPA
jgi:hypothetical protein